MGGTERMNVLHPNKKAAIITLLTNGISQREIKRKVRVDRKTIRKYARIKAQSPPESKSPGVATGSENPYIENPPPRPPAFTEIEAVKENIPAQARSACDQHRPWIEEQVGLGRNAMAIYQDMVESFAFEHRYNSVKRFVGGLKKKNPKQYDRLEFLPGEESQVDYGRGALTRNPQTGRYQRPRLFVMTLKYSRRSFRKVVWKSGQGVWARLHEEAFRYFGGCTQYVVLDNLREGVIKPDIYEPELNPVYAALLAHYGVVADPCRVADPDRKGTVENAIQHTQNTALKGRRFETIEQQNEWLMRWEENWASKRVHGRTKRQVQEMFMEEKPYLLVLPMTQFGYFSQEVRTVQDDGTIQVNDCFYAALPARLHSKVTVRIYEHEIEIIDPRIMEVIRRHPKGNHKGMVFMDEKDRIFNPSRQTRFLFARAADIGPYTKKLCSQVFDDQGRTGQRRMRGIIDLARNHKTAHIEQAARIALEKGISKCRVIRRIVSDIAKMEKAGSASNTVGLTQIHRLIRSPEDYALFFETHAATNDRKTRTLH